MSPLPLETNYMFSPTLAETRRNHFYNKNTEPDEVLSMPISGEGQGICLTILDSELGIPRQHLRNYENAEMSHTFSEKYPLLLEMVQKTKEKEPVIVCTGAEVVYKTKHSDTFVIVRYHNLEGLSELKDAQFAEVATEYDSVIAVKLGTNMLSKYLLSLNK